jgi:hypothetical protein
VHVAGSVITKIAMRFMKNDAEDYWASLPGRFSPDKSPRNP